MASQMVMNFTLRPAVKQDAPAIRRLIWRARINPTRLDWRHFTLAVDENGKLLGSGQIKPHRDGTKELASIAVQPEARHRGIASAIVAHLLAENPPPLYLICTSPLGVFYQRFGFVELDVEDMPPELKANWRLVNWLKRRLFTKMRGVKVMRWG